MNLLFLMLIAFLGGFAYEVEEDLDAVGIIEHYGYSVERHYVTTSDGYNIEIQRIAQGRDTRKIEGCTKRPVVFIMHGLFSSSYEFIANLPSQSPAYVLADAGFDVWMGNVRGNECGQNHTSLSTKDPQFWNFTFYDHSQYDMRSQVEYVLKQTGETSLYYIGHSQGTAIMFARLAEDKLWQNKIRAFFALGPTAGFVKPDLPLSLLEIGTLQRLAEFILDGKTIGLHPLHIPDFIVSAIAGICSHHSLDHICATGFFALQGRESLGQVNETRIPVYIKHFPTTTSTLNILHWVQVYKYHELRHLDLGSTRNLQVYGQSEAPRMDISKIEVPTYLYYSKDDHVTDANDVNKIIIKQMGPALKKAVSLDHFSHYDLAIGLRAVDEVFKPIIYQIYEDIQKNNC